MAADVEYQLEDDIEYYGTPEEITRKLDECKVCGSKLSFNHLPDYKNLLLQESARCMECGCTNRKVIHVLS